MGRGPRYKLVQYKSKAPYPASGSASARKVTRHVEHNCYTSTQGMATLSTSFLTKEVIVPTPKDGPQIDPRTVKLDEKAEIAYELAYLHHLDERDEEGPKRRPVPSDDPMRMWLPHRETFLQELINIDGRGDRPRDASGDDFMIIDVTGIHPVGIDFCACGGSNQSHMVQLLRSRLFPATVSNPKTAATFQALKTFELLSYESK
ncbi:hypothetical protein H0H92_003017, partial [Tricholoma furcatifolium]